ncbi:translation initiation factor 3 subunit F [Acrasis kona]|uniref:Translation initiation factor 3 subunit F n=1 Tax=Acrasis kona TaxID=1008807 RepID=A0AAW2ZDG1_9EUKA
MESQQNRYEIHPVVILSVLDHYARRSIDSTTTRIVGTLVGEHKEGVIEIKSSFPVPYKELDDTLEIDLEYHKNMLDCHKTVYPSDVVIGWYATGETYTESDKLIHDLYQVMRPYPVLLVVDTNTNLYNKTQQPFKTYIGHSDVNGDQNTEVQFEEVPVFYKVSENEKIGGKQLQL